jgi:trk system potassium uptake protein TrkH
MIIVTIFALVSLIINLSGIQLTPFVHGVLAILDWTVVFIFTADTFIRWGLNKFDLLYLKRNWTDFALTFSFLIILLVILGRSPSSIQTDWLPLFIDLAIVRIFIVLSRLYIVGSPIIRALSRRSKTSESRLAPAQLFILSFIFVILMGTGLLLLPEATTGKQISIVDALFTATSATCVTGLIVVDTGSYFTLFGQLVILVLIQIGGLGLMTVTTFFTLIIRKNMSVRESIFMSSTMNIKALSKVSNLLISTLTLTLSFEFIGVIFLCIGWRGNDFEWGSIVYYSIFHSISAFCNAGFSLFSNNLENYKSNITINITVTSLIIFGGLGFIVIMNLFHYLRFGIFKKEKLSLHTKMSLLLTAILIIAGFLIILSIEWNKALSDLPISTKIMGAYFHSVTPRTAGFNTINMTLFTNACYFITIIFMFIGASPGGTGGGIKTTTFGVFLVTIWSMLRGRTKIEIFRRGIPRDIMTNALLIITLSLMFLAVFAFILLITEDAPPLHIIFELFSAFGTVGLSAGITPNLTNIGKIIIIITMFIGRVGPLTMVLAIGQTRQQRKSIEFQYPEESVIIG